MHIFHMGFIPGVGPGEIILVFIIVLIIFGPGKLPELGKALGEGIMSFKKATKDVTEPASKALEDKQDNQ